MSSIDLFAAAVATQRRAYAIADAAVLADIETEGAPTDHDGARWYDVRPMLDINEHAPQVLDMARQALDYAADRGLIFIHPQARHLVRIARRTGFCAQG